jgi:hypothetical protein
MIEGSCVFTVRDQKMMSMMEESKGERRDAFLACECVCFGGEPNPLLMSVGALISKGTCMVKTHACGT